MKHDQFKIGEIFWTALDGTRVIVAICLSDLPEQGKGWENGPPYAITEFVFDENDFGGCYSSKNDKRQALSIKID